MSDPRTETVLTVLREAGVQTNLDDTDTLATKILNALDREHGTTDDEAEAEATPVERVQDLTLAGAGNPETPVGTATEGGAGDNA
jgi:hypothetical protein